MCRHSDHLLAFDNWIAVLNNVLFCLQYPYPIQITEHQTNFVLRDDIK